MKKINKGGLLALLSYFSLLGLVQAQEQFLKFTHPQADNYGEVHSPEILDSLILKLYGRELSFPEWTSFFHVKTPNSTQSTLGNYRIKERRIVFEPRFLPDPNIDYTVSFDFQSLYDLIGLESENGRSVTETITFKRNDTEKTEVTKVYPPLSVLPENTLKMYIYFSAPMSFANPHDHIALLDQEGNKMTNAFVELPDGLWNQDQTRLTLLFHPGRVKKGVRPNLEEGSVLKKGELFELVISQEWEDANGEKLSGTYSKKFFVTEPSRKKLKSKSWKIQSTCKEECFVTLLTGDIIDIEMANRMVSLRDNENKDISFTLIAEPDGSHLIKSEGMVKGKTYEISVNPRLEDMCGNTFLNLFDYTENTRVKHGKPIRFSFVVK